MALFLKLVSGVYLALIWLLFFGIVAARVPSDSLPFGTLRPIIYFLSAIGLSIPAVVMFAFGQIVGDVRVMRDCSRRQADDLRAMRAYYEPR